MAGSSRFVAASTRTSTRISAVPPTWRKLEVSSTRSSWTWVAWLTSPISSRKIVPPCATSNSPGLARAAPATAAPRPDEGARHVGRGEAPLQQARAPPQRLALESPLDPDLELVERARLGDLVEGARPERQEPPRGPTRPG